MMSVDIFGGYMTAEKPTKNKEFVMYEEKGIFITRSYEYLFQKLKQQHHDQMKHVE
jgi:hypothetical protein